MGCGNALQTAKEEYVRLKMHMRRENDEMRQNITRLKQKAEHSAVQLTAEQRRQNALNSSLALAKATLASVGNMLVGVRKQCFGAQSEGLSPDLEVGELSQRVMDLALSLQESALGLVEQLQQTTNDVKGFIAGKDPQFDQSSHSCTDLKTTLERLWEAREVQPAPSDTDAKETTQKLTALLEENQITVSMLSLQLSEKSQLVVSLQAELTTLEQELTSKGYVIAHPASVSLSYESDSEIQEGSVSDEPTSHHSNSTVE